MKKRRSCKTRSSPSWLVFGERRKERGIEEEVHALVADCPSSLDLLASC